MMRLPLFQYRAPRTIAEAAVILAGEGKEAMLLAGGTDLLPNMKRRQQVPKTVVALRDVEGLRGVRQSNGGFSLGCCTTITDIIRNDLLRELYPGLWQAAYQIATPHIRNMGTLGGNLCLDTRCNYYDQNYEWRKSINFCMKKDGDICWVATGSSKCMAVSSTDTAPALMALGARVRLVSALGEREIALSDLYRNNGIHYLSRDANEILAEILLEHPHGWKSTYWKLRRRGSFDFPVLSVAAAAQVTGGKVQNARIVVGSAASRPLEALEAASLLIGRSLDDDTVEQAATLAARIAKPLDNTDFVMNWRKKVAHQFVTYALRELRGDDMRGTRERITRHIM